MSGITRRDFVKNSVGAGIALSLSSASMSNVLGANDTINMAVIGIRSKGAQHINVFHELPNVNVVALCDVDKEILDREVQKFTDRGEKVKAYTDFRKVLDDKDVDAVCIATPNHWHSLISIMACQAKKDVYVEKPISHNVWEGRQLVTAAKKYKRIVQAGTQNRSDIGLREVRQYLNDGGIGKIKAARGFCYKRRDTIGKVAGPQPIPSSIDYDMWSGPTQLQPLMRSRVHYDWHWQWHQGNGDLGNQGIHEMDLCRWFLGVEGYPENVMSIGGRLGYVDDGTTANTQLILLEYEEAPILFEVRGLPTKKGETGMDNYKGIRIGVVIEGENGYFAGGRGGGWIYDNSGKKVKQFKGDGGGNHQQNFIDAVRSRKTSDLLAPVIEGHLSSALCHLGNISYRLGQETPSEDIKEAIKSEKLLPEGFYRMQEHLFQNWVDLKETPAKIGPKLTFDSASEKFITNEKFDSGFWANTMLKPEYREPFVVPEKV